MDYTYSYVSPLGALTVASDGTSVTGLWIRGQKYYASKLRLDAIEQDLPIFDSVRKWLDCYFSGKKPEFIPPLSPKGSQFQQSVWNILCEIPYGKVISYKDIVNKIALQTGRKSMSAQAVGGAVGHNPISIIIPCHRVIGSDGSLTGYAGGIEAKKQLLQLEGVDISRLYVPSKGTAL